MSRRRLGAGPEREPAGDGQQHVVRQVAVAVDAHLRRGEEVDVRARDIGPVVRKANRVQRGRADDVVLAERDAVRLVVAAADARGQHVLLRRLERERRRRELRGRDVAAEQRVLGVDRVIDLADVLSFVGGARQPVLHEAARIGRRRQPRGDVERRLAEQRRADPVADERRGRGCAARRRCTPARRTP